MIFFFFTSNTSLFGIALSYKEDLILLKYFESFPPHPPYLYSVLYPQYQGPNYNIYVWGKGKVRILDRLKWRVLAMDKLRIKKSSISHVFHKGKNHHKNPNSRNKILVSA